MEFQLWLYYLLAILILTATPGSNILLGVTTSVSSGFKSSTWFLAHGRAKFFNRITGGVFVGAGVLLGNSSRS